MPPGLSSLRLTSFKSHFNQVIKFEPLTLLVGRNGSGKSNALDALSLLALLADERDVNDLDRGDQEVAGLRGGLSGAAPYGTDKVKVGCSVQLINGDRVELDVELDASIRPEIIAERLVHYRKGGGSNVLIDSKRQSPGSGISDVQVYSGGAPRYYHLLSTRLASAQAVTKVPEDSRARRLVVACCQELIAALRGIFVLDPVPAQMREYVRIGSTPDRSGTTTSAVVFGLRENEEAWLRLTQLVQGLMEADVQDVTFSEGRLPDERLVDVMVAIVEKAGDKTFTAPARLMSDGTLRYLAIVASLLSLRSAADQPDLASPPTRTLVVEEIENGLFPSQAARVLDLLREEASDRQIRLLATTHSPALLDAMKPSDHAGVIVCDRTSAGTSELRRLVDHPRYVEIAGGGTVGRSVTKGLLEREEQVESRSLAELFAS